MENNYKIQAKIESLNSTDLRKQIGVIIVDNGVIVGRGSNQATIKWKWFIKWHKNHCFRKTWLLKKFKHRLYWICPGCALQKNHAEFIAIKSMKQTKELELYMYGHNVCCENCLNEIEKINIKKIYYEI